MRPISIAFGVVMLLLFWCYYASASVSMAEYFSDTDNLNLQGAGTWGDSFGAFNALVSALGAGAVVATLAFQQRSIAKQDRDAHLQRFESSFFELLQLMRDLRREVQFKHSANYIKRKRANGVAIRTGEVYKGASGLDAAVSELLFWHKRYEIKVPITKELIGATYDKYIARRNEFSLSPYFRLIYTILYRIENDKVMTDDEKASYGNLLRSQLTTRELYLIASNGCSSISKDLASYIEKYRLLKYLRRSPARSRMELIYKSIAFAART